MLCASMARDVGHHLLEQKQQVPPPVRRQRNLIILVDSRCGECQALVTHQVEGHLLWTSSRL
jgi:hypothetical protein